MAGAERRARRPRRRRRAGGQEPAAAGAGTGRRAALPDAGDGARVRAGAAGGERRGGGRPRGRHAAWCLALAERAAPAAIGAAPGPWLDAAGGRARQPAGGAGLAAIGAGEAEAALRLAGALAGSGACAATWARAAAGWSGRWRAATTPRPPPRTGLRRWRAGASAGDYATARPRPTSCSWLRGRARRDATAAALALLGLRGDEPGGTTPRRRGLEEALARGGRGGDRARVAGPRYRPRVVGRARATPSGPGGCSRRAPGALAGAPGPLRCHGR